MAPLSSACFLSSVLSYSSIDINIPLPSESSNLPPIKENRLLVEPALAEYGMEA